jgi:hypothetical protein
MEQSDQSLEARIADKFSLGSDEPAEQAEQSLPDPAEQPDEGSTEEVQETPYVDVELEGKPYKVPPELKDAFMARKQHTQEMQQLARNREALELAQQQIKAFAEHQQFEKSLSGELKSVDALKFKIAEKKDSNWAQMDAASIMKASLEIQKLEQELQDKTQALDGKRSEFRTVQQQRMQNYLEQARSTLSKSIPNWGEAESEKVTKYALARGFTNQEVGSIVDPRTVEALWKAMRYDEISGQKGDVLSKAQKAPPVVKPGAVKTMPQAVKDQFAFKKQLAQAKKEGSTPGATAKVIQQRLEQKLRRFS